MSQYINKIRTDQGDLQIDYNALANLPTISNPNLLINSDFRKPVNQRGKLTYTTTDAQAIYTIDRWRTKGLTVIVNDGSITIKNNASTVWSFAQIFEKPLPLDDYTLSINVLSVVGSPYMNVMYTDGSQSTARGLGSAGITSTTVNGIIQHVNIALKVGEEMTVQWVKLEKGKTTTPFSPRPYAEEFAMCQRYYAKLQTIYPLMVAQRNNAETFAYMFIPLPVALNDAPSITFVNAKVMKNGLGGSFHDLTDITCVGVCNSGVTLKVTCADSFEASIPYFLILPESGYIAFDAEIY